MPDDRVRPTLIEENVPYVREVRLDTAKWIVDEHNEICAKEKRLRDKYFISEMDKGTFIAQIHSVDSEGIHYNLIAKVKVDA